MTEGKTQNPIDHLTQDHAKKGDSQPAVDDLLCIDDCAPSTGFNRGVRLTEQRVIRRFEVDERFTVVDKPIELAVLINRPRSSAGGFSIEAYYPVPGRLQPEFRRFLRRVAFHPCVCTAGPFILPQKLDPPSAPPNSWNQSLAEALAHPPGQWLKIWVDRDLDRYQCDLVSSPIEDVPEYPDFKRNLEHALKPNIIDRVDHPVVQQILDARNRRNREIDDLDERIYE